MKLCRHHLTIFMTILILASLLIVSAKDQSISVSYDSSLDTSYSKTIDFSSVLLKVSTAEDSHCRYSTTKGVSYANMDGSFDSSLDTIHKKSFTGLGDGLYKYYIKCVEDGKPVYGNETELEVVLTVNSLVTAQIVMSEEDPLKAGTVGVKVVTSKIVSSAPALSFSFDGIVYSPIVLMGDGTQWSGYLVVEDDFGEGVVSFKFSANDLEGRQGTEIISGSVFEVDTIKPSIITDIEAVGDEDEIELEWNLDEDVDKFYIYRSESPNLDYTDYYKTTDDEDYTDNSVDEGETYYYRVAGVDEAGNIGELSKEVYATCVEDDDDDSTTGLSPNLRNKVESFLIEIDEEISEVSQIQSSIDLKTKKEIELFEDLNLRTEIDNAKKELNSLRTTVEKYKLQDLTLDELNSKLDSSRVKISVIKRKIPEDITILDEKSSVVVFSEEDVEELLFILNPLISSKNKDKSLDITFEKIDEENVRATSDFYVLEIVYSDGSTQYKSVVRRDISSSLEREANSYFIETFPSSVIDEIEDLEVQSSFDVVREDSIISFESDIKSIFYSIDERVDLEDLEDIKLNYVYVVEDELETSTITGYSIFGEGSLNASGIILVLIALIVVGVYFYYKQRNGFSEKYFELYEKTRRAIESVKKGDVTEPRKVYSNISEEYKVLSAEEKKLIYKELESLRNKILILDFEKGLEKLKETKDEKLLERLEKIYDALPLNYREKISVLFARVKREVNLGGETNE